MNKEQFHQIFNTYFDSIRGYLYYKTSDESVAEDIAQNVFMKLWEHRERFDPNNIKPILYKIASDMAISHYRKRVVRVDFAKNMYYNTNTDLSPEEIIQYEELKRKYAIVIREMNDRQREVFLMNREEGLKYNEIAQRLNISVKGVEKRMSQALKILKLHIYE